MIPSWHVAQHRLGLGLEPIDAIRGEPLVHALRVEAERGAARVAVPRHGGGRHALLLANLPLLSLDLRLYDPQRTWVARRLRVPLPADTELRVSHRVRRPVLFPGVAWPLGSGATAVRGRVHRDGLPVRWAWIEARRVDESDVVLRTRADDRGEYLLVLDSRTVVFSELPTALQFDLDLRAYGPAIPASPVTTEVDPMWDVPLEALAPPGDPDPVADASDPTLPAGWTVLGEGRVPLTLGRTVSDGQRLEF